MRAYWSCTVPRELWKFYEKFPSVQQQQEALCYVPISDNAELSEKYQLRQSAQVVQGALGDRIRCTIAIDRPSVSHAQAPPDSTEDHVAKKGEQLPQCDHEFDEAPPC